MTQKLWTRFLNQLVNLGSDEGNIIPFSLQEELVIGSTTLMIPAGLLWGILYFFLGEMWSGLIPFSYGLVLGFFFIIFLKNRNADFFVSTHHLLTLVLPFCLQLSLAGFINSGPVVAGVVGKKKFQYDVWGDMVNLASRMEAQGVAGKIQVTENTFRLLENKFRFEPRGILDVKGKGKMKTWFLVGRSKD